MILTCISHAPQIFGGIWKFIQILIWWKFEAMTFGITGVLANPNSITFSHYQVVGTQIEIALFHNFRYFKAFAFKGDLFWLSHILLWASPPILPVCALSKIHQNSITDLIEYIKPLAYPGWAGRLFWRTSETSKSCNKSSNQKGFQRYKSKRSSHIHP